MINEEYKNYLNSYHWKNLRRFMYERYDRCYFCYSKKNLNVHHTKYKGKKGKSVLFNENPRTLLVLCNDCHQKWHSLVKNKVYDLNFYREVKRLFKINRSLEKSFNLAKINILSTVKREKPKKVVKEVTYVLKKIDGKWETVSINGDILG